MKIFQYAFFLFLAFSYPAFSSSVEEKEEFKGNWTKTFRLIDGSEVVHTPKYVKLGFIQAGTGIDLQTPSYNSIPVTTYGIHLVTNSTEKDFVDALVKSGLYK